MKLKDDPDRPAYVRQGDDSVYEILIESVGERSVVLAWSPDLERFTRTGRVVPGTRMAILRLDVRDRADRRSFGWLGLQSLFGSPDVQGSLETLAPG